MSVLPPHHAAPWPHFSTTHDGILALQRCGQSPFRVEIYLIGACTANTAHTEDFLLAGDRLLPDHGQLSVAYGVKHRADVSAGAGGRGGF